MSGKTKRPLELAFISDIHLGHHRTPSQNIIRGLRAAFPDNRETGKLDIIFIGGDLFDRDVQLSDPQVTDIKLWMLELLRICARWNIKLRVLEGTPSHDRGQSVNFLTYKEMAQVEVDVKYVKDLSIEYIEDMDIRVLYVPDEWRHDHDITWEETLSLLKRHRLTQVDYAVMHGLFEFQLPRGLNIPTHRSERYLSIVQRYISIGHHHTMRQYDRIFAQGSFPRLAHGEEEDKGHIRVKDYGAGNEDTNTLTFVKNPHALRYETHVIGDETSDEAFHAILEAVKAYPEEDYVRFMVPRTCRHLPALRGLVAACTLEVKYVKQDEVHTAKLALGRSFTPTPLGASDIAEVIQKRLSDTGVSPETLQVVKDVIVEHI